MDKQNVKEEYIAIRSEILQLNSQAFTLVGGSLTLNFTILGFGLSRAKLIDQDPFIPFISILILFAANILIAHKIRMAHRIAFYQKYFIEPMMPGIRWGEIGFKFRTAFDKKHSKFFVSVAERFVLIQTAIISVAQLISVTLLIQCQQSSMRTFFLIISAVLLFVQTILLRYINDYETMKKVFKEIAGSQNSSTTINQSRLGGMYNMEEHKIEPHKITKPIQLMAVWFVALLLIDSSLLTAATFIKEPSWIPPLLVISAICVIPLFLVCIFLIQTVFRRELQDDPYYSKWLLGEKGRQAGLQPTGQQTVTKVAVDSNVKRRSLMEYMILNTLWTKQVNKWPDLSLFFTFSMNFVSPSETKAFKDAGDILIGEGLITVSENGQYMLTIAGFDYCKKYYKEFPKEQWWPEEQINQENLNKVIGMSERGDR